MWGYWLKVNSEGSECPMAKQNMTMVCEKVLGGNILSIIGGSKPTKGSTEFEQHEFSFYTNRWKKIVKTAKPLKDTRMEKFLIPTGAHMVEVNNNYYLFSGQTPMPNSQSGVRVCAPDLYKFDTMTKHWSFV